MKDIQVDASGELHCWNCGSKAFTEKRTFRAKAIGGAAGFLTLGVAAAAVPLVTKKKLRCQVCGEYNDVGSAQPFDNRVTTPIPPAQTPLVSQPKLEQLTQLGQLRDCGVVSPDEFEKMKLEIFSSDTQTPIKSEYTVVLLDGGVQKIRIIKLIRESTKLGLRAAKDICDRTPSVILRTPNSAVAESVKSRLEKNGATVEIR